MKHLLVISFLLLGYIHANAQYHITDVTDLSGADKPASLLSKNEILLVCFIQNGFAIDYSVDKSQWGSKKLKQEQSIEISLDDGYAYFYVRVCNTHSQVNCIDYRLAPGKRYALKLNDEGDVVIRSGVTK